MTKYPKTGAILLAGTILGLPGALLAQETEEIEEIEELVVLATRIPTTQDKIGSTVAIVDRDEIEIRQEVTVAELLRQVAGLALSRNGTLGGAANVRLRGAESGQTLVLINGVKVNDLSTPGGAFNFANLLTDNIERIEVLKGPQSTLYGSNAIGGVINIITRKVTDGSELSLFAEGGSFGTGRFNGSLGGKRDQTGFQLSASYVTSHGFSSADEDAGNSEADGYENITLYGALDYEIGSHVRVGGTLRYLDAQSQFDSFDFILGIVDGDESEDTLELQGNIFVEAEILDGLWSHHLNVGWARTDRSDFAGSELTFDANSRRRNIEYLGTLRPSPGLVLLVGGELEKNRIATESFGFFASLEAGEADVRSIFGELQYSPWQALTLTAGVRRDDHDAFGGATTFRTTAALRIAASDTILRANWGEGFKAPTLSQLFGSFGDPTLEPEESTGFEFGLEQGAAGGRLVAGLSYFNRRTENQVNFDFGSFRFANLDRTRSRGVEVTVAAEMGPGWKLLANYTHMTARDRASGNDLLRRPDTMANANIHWSPEGPLSFSMGLNFTGSQLDVGGQLDNFIVVDLRGRYQFKKGFEFFARIENLFDETYQEIGGFGTADISAFAGFRLRR